MFQKIASICSIASFFAGIYIIFADHPRWQWFLLFVIGLSFIFIALIAKKRKQIQSSKIITFSKNESLPNSSGRKIGMEVFYPKPFEHTPHLQIIPPTKRYFPGRTGLGSSRYPPRVEYKITEQRPDGFKIEFLSFPSIYKPMFKWQAEGKVGKENKNKVRYLYPSKQNKEGEGHIGRTGPTD